MTVTEAVKRAVFWGCLGAIALLLASGFKVIVGLEQVMAEKGAIGDLLRLIPLLLGIGFLCGFLSSLLWMALERFGLAGKSVIGAVLVPMYLFSFLFAFGEEAWATYADGFMLTIGVVIGAIAVPIAFPEN